MGATEIITTDYVNVRTGPGMQFEIVETLSPDSRLEIVSTNGDWLQIHMESNRNVWIHSDYTKALPVSNKWNVLQLNLTGNIRPGPGMEFPVIATIAKGRYLIGLQTSNDWTQVIIDSMTVGWINRLLVSDLMPVKYPESVLIVQKFGNLRSGPGLDYEIITQLESPEKLLLLEKQGDWNKVYTSMETVAYINDIIIAPILNPVCALPQTTLAKNGNLRYGPATTYGKIQLMYRNENVYLLRRSGNWFEVITESGSRGWAHEILFEKNALPDQAILEFLPDSIVIGINTLDIARYYRKTKQYGKALHAYRQADSLFKSFHLRLPDQSRPAYYHAKCLYIMAQNPYLNQDPNVQQAIRILSAYKRDDTHYQKINRLIQSWKQTVSNRAEMYITLTDTNRNLRNSLNFFTEDVLDYPLLTEAELKRFVGRYYGNFKDDPNNALPWQIEAVSIYREFRLRSLALDSLNQDNYFYGLIELASSHAKLDHNYDSMTILDEAQLLIDEYNNAAWHDYYQRTVESVINRLH